MLTYPADAIGTHRRGFFAAYYEWDTCGRCYETDVYVHADTET